MKNIKSFGLILLLIYMVGAFNSAFAGTSREARGESIIFGTQTVIGLDYVSFYTHPTGLGFYLGESLSIAFEAGRGSMGLTEGFPQSRQPYGDYDDYGLVIDSWESELENYEVHLRWFLGNSFYLMLRGNNLKWNGKLYLEDNDYYYGDTATVEFDIDSKALSLGVGNQWIVYDWIIIGATWYSQHLSAQATSSYSITSNSGISEDDVDERTLDAIDALRDIAGYQTVSFYVGFAF